MLFSTQIILCREKKCKRVLSGQLLASLTTTAFAEAQTETTEIAEYHWEDFEPLLEQAGIPGDYYTFNSFDLQMWIPDVLEIEDVPDEDREQGIYVLAASEDEKYQMVIRRYAYENEIESIEEWQELLRDQMGIDESVICYVNGLKVLEYQDTENDVFFCDIHITDGSILEFIFKPFSNQDYATCIVFMVNSLMPETEE